MRITEFSLKEILQISRVRCVKKVKGLCKFLVYFRTVTLEVAVVTKMPGSIVLLTFW